MEKINCSINTLLIDILNFLFTWIQDQNYGTLATVYSDIVLGGLIVLWTDLNNKSHMFSIGFRSDEIAGHYNLLIIGTLLAPSNDRYHL